MSHLPTERLAALVDESPTPPELAHLASCAECARERAMFQSLADLSASESSRLGLPLTKWESLAPALTADGVIDTGRGFQLRSAQVRRPWMQAAAAVLLIAGGMMAGRYSAGAAVLPMNDGQSSGVAALGLDTSSRFRSVADAKQVQAQSQVLYETATAFLAQQDTTSRPTDSPSAIRARLAAIEQTQDVMGEALKKAPYDAVINDYYLSVLGQREATLRQLNAVMPASMKITSY
jgi:hypothetical protein